MKNSNIKTIDLHALEYRDKTNGNSYFSAIITLNFGLKNEREIKIPFQYGYDSQFEFIALQKLQSEKIAQLNYNSLSFFCRENKIVFRKMKKENCNKKDVENFVK